MSKWAKLASTPAPEPRVEVPLEPLRRMIRAAEQDARVARRSLGGLLKQSKRTLYPRVGDPLDDQLEVGSHRWLKRDREESYSDWLAWILERQEDPARILPLFGLDARTGTYGGWTVEREVPTRHGRLDLVIRDARQGALCVEVKTQSFPEVDQIERYGKWLDGQRPRIALVLLAVDESEGKMPYDKFCSWRDVSLRLRTWARDWLRASRYFDASMTLAFCGAVERNLLSLGSVGLNALRTADYLQEVWRGCHAQKKTR